MFSQLPGGGATTRPLSSVCPVQNYRLQIDCWGSEARGKSIGDGDGDGVIRCHGQEQKGGEAGAVHVWKVLIGCREDAHFRVSSASGPPRHVPACPLPSPTIRIKRPLAGLHSEKDRRYSPGFPGRHEHFSIGDMDWSRPSHASMMDHKQTKPVWIQVAICLGFACMTASGHSGPACSERESTLWSLSNFSKKCTFFKGRRQVRAIESFHLHRRRAFSSEGAVSE